MANDSTHLSKPERTVAAPVWLFLSIFVVSLAFHFPGWMTLDSTSQLQQARSFILNDGHPPSLAIIWSFLDKIVPGPFLMLILNILVHLSSIWLISSLFKSLTTRSVFLCVVYFFPPTFLTIGMIWKDTLMNGGLLLSAGAAIAAFVGVARRRNSKITDAYILLSIVSGFFAISFRHNAPAGALATLCLVVFYILMRFKWNDCRLENTLPAMRSSMRVRSSAFMATVAGGIALTVLTFGMAKFTFDRFVTNEQHFWQVLAFHDIAAISVQTEEDRFPTKLYEGMKLETLEEHYVSYSVLPLTRNSGVFRYLRTDPELERLAEAWKTSILEEPGAYLKHRWNCFLGAIGAGEIHPWAPIIREPIPQIRAHLVQFEVAAFQQPWRKDLSNKIVREEPLLFEPYVYLLITLALIVALIFHWIIQKQLSIAQWATMILLLSGLGYEVSLFFVTPSPDFRYSTYMIFCTVAAVFIYCVSFDRRLTKKVSTNLVFIGKFVDLAKARLPALRNILPVKGESC
ncbi:hypothetical protein [Hirschia maritima]|uniref:hypothetical protein n=1 Tax=Hirschia maritima TaxID=1121961 RepID=UPI0003813F82|nr:hypothetical protein [Hirschia maritima]